MLHKKRVVIKQKDRVIGHGVHFFPGIRKLPWHELRKVENMLAPFSGACKIRTFFKGRPNLFLKLYNASWRPKHACLVAG